ncbi:aquaporin AQPAn.G [Lingula anatina]|uniref:Aquaporin AQPAn.G n=1 Tax=Lingula anatina TaxID=7574 RepID=A0A1S3I2Z4_LINAN|nr:aquaporin AQPAn.G [Lingula anatina]|eukprot:XP_013392640.1 aquaporin AQPAn.G [Lingula anatina]
MCERTLVPVVCHKISSLKTTRVLFTNTFTEMVESKYKPIGINEFRNPLFYRAFAAEFIGTLLLVLVGCGAITGDRSPVVAQLQISLVFGFTVGTIVWIFGNSSGGHINPAVTVAMWAVGNITFVKAVFYIVAQVTGAVGGAALLNVLTPANATDGGKKLGANLLSPGVTVSQGVGIEIFCTLVLVFTVFAACDGSRTDLSGSRPLSIGIAVTMAHLYAHEYTGCSMNPARSLGPALISDTWTNHWVYWVGPLVGGLIAGFLYEFIFAEDASVKKLKRYLACRCRSLLEEGEESSCTNKEEDFQNNDSDFKPVEFRGYQNHAYIESTHF